LVAFHPTTLAILILTRRPGETIIIETPVGEHIEVAVLIVEGNQVRFGIEACCGEEWAETGH